MKVKAAVATSLFAFGTLISMGAIAASDTDQAADGKPAATQSKEKVKPHSHAEEKGNIVSKSDKPQGEKADPTKDSSRHLHARDGK